MLKTNEKIKLFKGNCEETETKETAEIVKKWFMICYGLAKRVKAENEKYRKLEEFYKGTLEPIVEKEKE